MNSTLYTQRGLSFVEILAVISIAGMIMVALGSVVSQALEAESTVRKQNNVQQQARFAMRQMIDAVGHTQTLLLPLTENPTTSWQESIREPGVLAVTLSPFLDRDNDGFADADNDKDGLIDEDMGKDICNDNVAGIKGIDDNNDGKVDDVGANNDDEDGSNEEEILNGIDDDGDGSIDEDLDADMNQDNKAGVVGVDDDGDTSIDEGDKQDDDEDGLVDEDWYDAVVFYLSGSDLIQRMPNINPTNGEDYSEYTIADNVKQFRVERIQETEAHSILLNIILELQGSDGEIANLNTTVRVGAAP